MLVHNFIFFSYFGLLRQGLSCLTSDMIFLPIPSKCWAYWLVPLLPAFVFVLKSFHLLQSYKRLPHKAMLCPGNHKQDTPKYCCLPPTEKPICPSRCIVGSEDLEVFGFQFFFWIFKSVFVTCRWRSEDSFWKPILSPPWGGRVSCFCHTGWSRIAGQWARQVSCISMSPSRCRNPRITDECYTQFFKCLLHFKLRGQIYGASDFRPLNYRPGWEVLSFTRRFCNISKVVAPVSITLTFLLIAYQK